MKRLYIYVDASAIGGCEDSEFAKPSLSLWRLFIKGVFMQVLSEHTLRELSGAPENVRAHLLDIPVAHQIILADTPEADALAEAYLAHGIVGPGSRSDAFHVALATVAHVDVLVSWNFKHVVNLDKIRLFNAVNLEQGYGLIEIRTPREVLSHEENL
ncbi:MAG: type II toxin-antitoxin system VapC family toxin [Deltaproteobacteria bacterium]|nr:type II toxin-antitoxin system VapC family toxin [Deltaproteobacteria bacterium]